MPTPSVSPRDIVLTLVESVGRRSEADFYIRLFQQLPKHAFAVVAPDASALKAAQGLVVEHLRFLHHLGLTTTVALGLFEPAESAPFELTLAAKLQEAGLAASRHHGDDAHLPATLTRELVAGTTPIVRLGPKSSDGLEQRFEHLGRLCAGLRTRKLVLVRGRGGLGSRLSVVSLRRDLPSLLQPQALPADDQALLRGVRLAMQRAAIPGAEQLVTSVTSPTNLLHELFTVKGAGTLIKQGSVIDQFDGYAELDRARLVALLEATFGRGLRPEFFDRPATAVYLESDYRGAAIVREAQRATFLTKFAVGPLARGLGLGRDLWDAVTANHPALFWRARPDNPIAAWYESQCDGRVRTEKWMVYWRGVPHGHVGELVDDALAQPVDLLPPPQAIPEGRPG